MTNQLEGERAAVESIPRSRLERLLDAELCDYVRMFSTNPKLSRDAYGELYRRHRNVVSSQAFRYVKDTQKSEDLTSEAFSNTFRALKGGRGPQESFLGYVLVALRSSFLTADQEPNLIVETPVEDVTDEALFLPDHSIRINESDQVSRAFRALPESWQDILLKLEVEERATEEVAGELNLALPAVRALAFRARGGLREAYLQQYVDMSSSTCGRIPDLLAAYVREGLTPRKRAEVVTHLANCDECTGQVSRLSRLNEQLRAWAGPIVLAGGGSAAFLGLDSDQASAVDDTQRLASGFSPAVRVGVILGSLAALVLAIAGVYVIFAGANSGSDPSAPSPESNPQQSTEPANEVPSGDVASKATGVPQIPSSVSPLRTSTDEDVSDPYSDPETNTPGNAPVRDDTTPFWELQ